jgi:ribosomal-protein-alanine N-acetyltransferase
MTKSTCQLRWLIRRDLPVVLGIERTCFPYPWSEENFLYCLSRKNCIGFVAERHERIVGFMIIELHRDRLQLLNFAVAWDERRQGIGEQMVRRLIDKIDGHTSRRQIVADVCESNLGGQLFFKQMGFKAIGVLHSHYSDPEEDAYRMRYTISHRDEFTPKSRITELLKEEAGS